MEAMAKKLAISRPKRIRLKKRPKKLGEWRDIVSK
jgi:hypothetical protein